MAFKASTNAMNQLLQSVQYPQPFPAPPPFNSQALAVWGPQLQTWWQATVLVLQRQYSSVADAIGNAGNVSTEIDTLTTEFNALTATVTSLQTQLTALKMSQGNNSGSIAALAAQVATLIAQAVTFTAHIAAHAAHGTLSPIVGESDVQPLDSKTIGANQPGYGAFTALMCSQDIPAGSLVQVGFQQSMVVAGPLTVEGTLVVTGRLVVI